MPVLQAPLLRRRSLVRQKPPWSRKTPPAFWGAAALLASIVLLFLLPPHVHEHVLARLDTDEVTWELTSSPEEFGLRSNYLHSSPRGRIRVSFNGRPGREFDAVSFPLPNRTATTIVYSAREGSNWYVVRGHTVYGPYDFATHAEFDYHTGTVATWDALVNGKRVAVVEGTELTEEEQEFLNSDPEPSPGDRVRTESEEDNTQGRMRIVFDGVPGPWISGAFQPVWPSPDRRHVAYLTYDGDGIDG